MGIKKFTSYAAITAFLLLFLPAGCSSGGDAISTVDFRDSALAACLRESGYRRLEDVTRLRCEDAGIEELEGIERFYRLAELRLPGNYISDLAPLASLANLRVLDLDLSPVVDLSPISSLTSLETLSLVDGLLKDVTPLASLTALKELDLSDNLIQDAAPLSSLTELRSLDLSINHISKGVAALKTLKKAELINLAGNIHLPDEEVVFLAKALGAKKVNTVPRSM
jgi:internalin A